MPEPRVITLPARRTRAATLTERKRPAPSYVISRTLTLPGAIEAASDQERWMERMEREHRGGYTLHRNLLPQEAKVPAGTVITMPRRQREGSITDEQLKAIHEAVNGLTDKRGAVVVCEGMDSENSARNKARAAATLHEETYPTIETENGTVDNPRRYLTAHAIPDPDNEGKFIGAVSVRPQQKPKETTPENVSDGGTPGTAGNEGNTAKTGKAK